MKTSHAWTKLLPLAFVLAACGPKTGRVPAGAETGGPSDATGTEDSSDEARDEGGSPSPYDFSSERDVDILFVIDNSGSMGEEQANLSRNFAGFLDELESVHVRANYRIAFTTTDNSNPWCLVTTPEGGKLVLSSCRSRLDDFVFGSGPNLLDQTSACLDHCPAELEDIEILPTTTQADATPKPRQWLERTGGITNLPAGVGTAQAMSCFGPQGIDGCGFESPLESMYKALVRARTEGEASFGFLRDDAMLVIVIVTDETDCSYDNDWAEIFERDGLRTFWSIPDVSHPTSAVCWNAGVECSGGPDVYDECHAVDLDVRGNRLESEEASGQAVLHPLRRYIDFVSTIKPVGDDGTPDVFVALIAGVPSEYPAVSLVYADAAGGTPNDPDFQRNFGIGPGCTSANGEAVPPVREREFAEHFAWYDENNVFSVCDDDYGPALHAIAARIRDRFRPACMHACVADTDPSQPGLDEDCTLEHDVTFGDGSTRTFPVPKCSDDRGTVPEGALLCYIPIDVANDPQASFDCVADGVNLEFVLVHAPGPALLGVTRAECELSPQPQIDCPDLLD